MKSASFVGFASLVACLLPPLASAQDGTSTTDSAAGAVSVDANAQVQPPPAPPPQPPPTPPPPPPPREPEPADDTDEDTEDSDDYIIGTGERPEATFGLGAGWTFPGSEIWMPSTIAARFRLASGITLEPSVTILLDGRSTDTGATTVDSNELTISVGTQLRVPLMSLGPLDFLFLGTASLSYGREFDPGDTHDIGFTLGYGLGLEFWFSKRWSLGLDATNSIVAITWSQDSSGATDQSNTDYRVGAVWDPALRILTTLYLQ